MGAKHKWINLALTAGFGMLLICFPAESAQGVINGMKLALGKAIPALFPYFVLSGLVLGSGFSGGKTAQRVMRKVFHLPAACAPAMLLGFLGGYPVGARTAEQLYREGACTEEELSRLLTFCIFKGKTDDFVYLFLCTHRRNLILPARCCRRTR